MPVCRMQPVSRGRRAGSQCRHMQFSRDSARGVRVAALRDGGGVAAGMGADILGWMMNSCLMRANCCRTTSGDRCRR
jgi:hypothetical protein